jgi:hypothetical protein
VVRPIRSALRLLFFAAVVSYPASALAQSLFVGAAGTPQAAITLTGVSTVLQLGYVANKDGNATFATFAWSAAPCPAAVKIKFFRPSSAVPGGSFLYLDQRGPFDVTTTLQTVRLDPPVAIRAGDVIAITNLTSCGAPMMAGALPGGLPSAGPFFTVSGDVITNVPSSGSPSTGPSIILFATDDNLSLLNNRFRLTLVATNPRTGTIAQGSPVQLVNSAGYFSLPDFTGDRFFPEVMVKMADATGIPSLGGTFWVFHSPLTDVQYTLTVTDSVKNVTRTYRNAASTAGQLCGGVDTSAFVP